MAGIRSSSRKNKGKNKRLQELEKLESVEMAALTKGKRGKKRKVPDDEKNRIANKRYRTANDDGWAEEAKKLRITSDGVCCLPCGTTDLNYNEEEDTGLMIQCEKCKLWQHSKCLLGTEDDKLIPEHYMCNVCDVENPKYANLELKLTWSGYIDLMRKGKRMKKEDYILEEAPLKKEKKEDGEEEGNGDKNDEEKNGEEKNGEEKTDGENIDKENIGEAKIDDEKIDNEKKIEEMKGGEKEEEEKEADADNISADNSKTNVRVEKLEDSKEGDVSESMEKATDAEKDDADYIDMPDETPKKKNVTKEPADKSKPQARKEKGKNPAVKNSSVLDRITKTRSSVTQQFARKFKAKLETLSKDLQNEGNPDKWAKNLEEELYNAFPAAAGNRGLDEYVKRSRTLIFNLGKANLMDKIVKNGFNFASIVRLTPEEMMRDDYKELANEVKKQSMNQTILPDTNERVRIRRTHRGEEIVETDEFGKKSVEDARLEEIEKLREVRERKLKAKKEKELETVGMLGVMNGNGEEDDGVQRKKVPQGVAFSIPMTGNFEDEDESQFTVDDGLEKGKSSGDSDEIDDDDEFNKILEGVSAKPDRQEGKSGKERDDNDTKERDNGSAKKEANESKRSEEEESVDDNDDYDYDPLDTITVDPTVWTGKLEFPGAGIITTKALFKCSTATEKHKGNLVSKAKKMLAEMKSGSNGLFNAGRLSMSTADDYLMKVIQSRDFYMDELVPYTEEGISPVETQANIFTFMRVWDYFHSLRKFGVLDGRPEYVKDCYIVCLSRDEMLNGFKVPSFLDFFDRDKLFRKLEKEKENEPEEEYEANDKKMFIVFVAKKNLDYILESKKESFNEPLASIMDQLAS